MQYTFYTKDSLVICIRTTMQKYKEHFKTLENLKFIVQDINYTTHLQKILREQNRISKDDNYFKYQQVYSDILKYCLYKYKIILKQSETIKNKETKLEREPKCLVSIFRAWKSRLVQIQKTIADYQRLQSITKE